MADTIFARMFRRSGGSNLIRQFGEPVQYWKAGATAARSIQAMVERGTPEIIAETGDVNSQAIIVRVKNSTCDGIGSTEVDTGGDEISVPLRVSDTAERRSIVKVLNDNAGLVRVLCQ